MQAFQSVAFRHPALRQAATPAVPSAQAAPAPIPAPPPVDMTKKIVTGAITLAVLGSASWGGFYAAKHTKGVKRIAGYAGGVGAAALGLAVLAAAISIPSVSQTLTIPFSVQPV